MEMDTLLELSLHKKQVLHDMKKTVIALLALASFVQAGETYLIKDDNFSQDSPGKITLDDIATTFSTGSFAISFDFASVLSQTGGDLDFHFGLGDDNTTGKDLSFSYRMGYVFFGSSLGSGFTMIFETPELLIFQVNDFFGNTPTATLYGYSEGAELSTILSAPISTPIPSTISIATVTLTSIGGGVKPAPESVGLAVWQGEVTPNDIENPTPAPAVPEPATATLSLLALAGLAARRRRK